MSSHVYCGNFVHATDDKPMDVVTDYALGVKDGKILFFQPKDRLKELLKKYGLHSKHVQQMTEGQFMMPGLVDVHNNVMLYPLSGTSVALPYWDVVKSRCWPLETRYHDPKFAKKVFTKAVDRNVKNGITTACYRSGIHAEAAIELWDIVDKVGQRAFIGKCNRDTIRGEVGYDAYMELTNESLKATRQFLYDVKQKKSPLITPIISPSALTTVTPELMNGLYDSMRINEISMQISLSLDESDDDDAVRIHGRKYVGGGYNSSLLETIRNTVMASKALSFQKSQDYESVTLEEAFMLATLGGSQVLGIDNKIGNFEPGKELDALLIDVNTKHSVIDVFKEVDECPPTAEDTVCKFLLTGDDRNIVQVIVAGKAIIDKQSMYTPQELLQDIKHKLPTPLSK
ncbi:guanine deaminase-like [Saccoglossus kowalevskii]|uniref:Guanine deaminase-like n=1 Tax=Saccoglossus kowalevskii TaxID=10224 RepID=A0ABM0MHE2_SACKO|nr:PREDICTED: guanine deaminase-like [Saccoglossus kowalevskii]